jgi:iron complex transport system ATP-binding protein
MNSKTLALHRAVMPQSLELNFNFTAQQVIEMALLFTPSSEQQSIIDEVSELLALENLLHKAYPQLSGGEKQRVQLARVIAQLLQKAAVKPAYLLLDEATSAMDLAMMHQAFSLLKKITEKQIGVVAVVHDLNLASHYADEIVLISGQSTSHVGKPKDIVTEENIADVFSANIAVLEHPTLKHPVILYQ